MRDHTQQRRVLLSVAWGCIAFAVASVGCVSLHRPSDVALRLYTVGRDRDAAAGDKMAPPSAYNVIAAWPGGAPSLEACGTDIGGGVRCTFVPLGCGSGSEATLTMHLEPLATGEYRVTAASIAGVFTTFADPDYGTLVRLQTCGLQLIYAEPRYAALTSLLTSELSSKTLVPWPYADAPHTRADTTLAISRVQTNRARAAAAIAALREALALGEDTMTVATNAIVEAAATMDLRVTPPHYIDPTQPAKHFVWQRDPSAYPTDTIALRRGLEWIDFAMEIAHPQTAWNGALVLAARGRTRIDTRTPSIAALDEMSGMTHYLLGRSYLSHARQSPACDVFRTAYKLLSRGYADFEATHRTDEADAVDDRGAASAAQLLAQADSSSRDLCEGKTIKPD